MRLSKAGAIGLHPAHNSSLPERKIEADAPRIIANPARSIISAAGQKLKYSGRAQNVRFALESGDGLTHLSDAQFFSERRRIGELAATYLLPATYEAREYVEDGGLMSYGPNIPDLSRRAAVFVVKILNGVKTAGIWETTEGARVAACDPQAPRSRPQPGDRARHRTSTRPTRPRR
jgi:hypothetical protein